MSRPIGSVAVNRVGMVYGRLTVASRESNRGTRAYWRCNCSCGGVAISSSSDLVTGHIRSCGCLNRETRATNPRTHGYNRTPTYVVWSNMHARCNNDKRPDFKNYGGRGITVCERWREFANFLADMGEKPPCLSLDRRDNNGHYGPNNCRWATASEQRRNQRPMQEIRAAAAIGQQEGKA